MYCKLDTAIIAQQGLFKVNAIIPHSLRFTQKTGTCELCPSPLRAISISIAIGDGTETQSSWQSRLYG